MYRSDDEARLRRELSQSKETIASLNKEISSHKKEVNQLHAELTKLKRKSSFISWIVEIWYGFVDRVRYAIPYLLMFAGVCLFIGLVYFICSATIEYASRNRYVGTIVDKEYHPPYTTYTTQCTTVNKVQSCRTVPIHHPESWTVDLRNDNQVRSYTIDEELFDRIERNHWLCLPDATLEDCNHGHRRAVYQ